MQTAVRDFFLAEATAVIPREASTAMTAMTVSSSTSVNAAARGAPTAAGRHFEQERRRRQGAAGILPAVLFSDWSAGKMPAAL